jgi:hypothetical protein
MRPRSVDSRPADWRSRIRSRQTTEREGAFSGNSIAVLRVGVVALLLTLVTGGCSTPKSGPYFVQSHTDKTGYARLYVYRLDAVPSSGIARIKLQDETVGRLANRQFLELDIRVEHPLGDQVVSIFFRAWPVTFDWGDLPLRPEVGKTYFLRLAASPMSRVPETGQLENAHQGGRRSGFGVGLLRSFRSAEAALPEIRTMRLAY